ncbi:hypothetical protein BDZ88DRAFT_25990 [Geranomyces variabilis]|nr:hypothetical protein BDZ88DRAFT_25990 [Geranomyces variabilis]
MSRKQQKLTYYEKSLHTSLASAQSSIASRVNSITSWLPHIKWPLTPMEPDNIEDETEDADIAVDTDFAMVQAGPPTPMGQELSKATDFTDTTSTLDIASILEIASPDPQQATLGSPDCSQKSKSKTQTATLSPSEAAMGGAEAAEQERLAEEMLDIDLMAELLSISELDYSIPGDGSSDNENHSSNGEHDMPILSIDDILNMPDPRFSSGVDSGLRAIEPAETLQSFEKCFDDSDVHAPSRSPAASPPHNFRTERHGTPVDSDEYAERPPSGTRITALPSDGTEPEDDGDNAFAASRSQVGLPRSPAPGSAGGSPSVTPSPPLRKIMRPTSIAGRSRTVVSSLGREQAAALRRSARLKAAGGDRGERPN